MSDRNKNKKISLAGFLQYFRKELEGRERNSFERELQKDPFAYEAMEGFELTDGESAEKDIAELKARLKKRTKRKGSVVFYRIAASIAIMAALSVVFLLTRNTGRENQIAENSKSMELLEIRKSQPLIQPELSEAVENKQETAPKNKRNVEINTREAETEKAAAKSELQEIDSNAGEIVKSADAYTEPEPRPARASAAAKEKLSMAGDEAVVYYTDKRKSKADDSYNYSPPVPLIGKAEFEKYITENIIYPDTLITGVPVVELSFTVRSDGTIDSLKTIASPGKAFSAEAVRLIKSGPAWKPATKNGIVMDDSVRITINFREL